jgi:hypothetical protein
VDKLCLFVEVSETSYDLTEDHASVVLEEGRASERFEDVKERTGRAVEGEEVDVGVGVVEGEEREDVLMGEERPGCGLAQVVLESGWVGEGNDFCGGDRARRQSRLCG